MNRYEIHLKGVAHILLGRHPMFMNFPVAYQPLEQSDHKCKIPGYIK